MAATLARQLEETFRPALAAALGESVSLRCHNENDHSAQPLPLLAVILTAEELDLNRAIKVAGRCPSNLGLRAECRAHGSAVRRRTARLDTDETSRRAKPGSL